jgi:hypothetical protein
MFMRFHGVFLGCQHEMWSKQHNGKVRRKVSIIRVHVVLYMHTYSDHTPATLYRYINMGNRAKGMSIAMSQG